VIGIDGLDVFSASKGQLLGSISPGTTSKSGVGKFGYSSLVLNRKLINSVASLASNLFDVSAVEAILRILRILDVASWAAQALTGLAQELGLRASVGFAAFLGFSYLLSDEAVDLTVFVVGTVVVGDPDPACSLVSAPPVVVCSTSVVSFAFSSAAGLIWLFSTVIAIGSSAATIWKSASTLALLEDVVSCVLL